MLRFGCTGNEAFGTSQAGVAAVVELGRLLPITGRILCDEELQLIFVARLAFNEARLRASRIDQHGPLPLAKFRRKCASTA